MRVLVEGAGLEAPGSRLRQAAIGLGLRGHDVLWRGTYAPAGLMRSRGTTGLALDQVDVVVGSGGAMPRVALAGWLSRAHAAVLELDAQRVQRWSVFDRWMWHSQFAVGLFEASDADAARGAAREIPLDRLALWSDEPQPVEPDPGHPDTEILERACERAVRRAARAIGGPAVFVDRDGTLVVERGYLSDPADLELLPDVAEGLRALQAAGFALVVVSNQSGVGRGLFSLSTVYAAMARLRALLRKERIELDAIYFCPHRPEAQCQCRKPGTELLERAAEDLQLDLRRSAMVGDKLLDAETGRRAGARGVLVRTGYGRDEEQRIVNREFAEPPEAVVDDLREAAGWIIARRDSEAPA